MEPGKKQKVSVIIFHRDVRTKASGSADKTENVGNLKIDPTRRIRNGPVVTLDS